MVKERALCLSSNALSLLFTMVIGETISRLKLDKKQKK